MWIPRFAHSPGGATLPAVPFAGLARRVAAAFRRWRQARRSRAELAALDEATLRDIGIQPWQVPGLGRTAADADSAWDPPRNAQG
jgi:uncharacterized protein YjiS (DUF1127 family)